MLSWWQESVRAPSNPRHSIVSAVYQPRWVWLFRPIRPYNYGNLSPPVSTFRGTSFHYLSQQPWLPPTFPLLRWRVSIIDRSICEQWLRPGPHWFGKGEPWMARLSDIRSQHCLFQVDSRQCKTWLENGFSSICSMIRSVTRRGEKSQKCTDLQRPA